MMEEANFCNMNTVGMLILDDKDRLQTPNLKTPRAFLSTDRQQATGNRQQATGNRPIIQIKHK
jgi:hypothetical protein